MRETSCIKITPPRLARRWGIGVDKVFAWIRSGELRAVNAATNPSGRPRFLIDVADIEAFERQRQVQPPQPVRRLRRRPVGNVTEFV